MRIAFFIAVLCLLAAAPVTMGAPDEASPDAIVLCDGRTFTGSIRGLDEDGSLLLVGPEAGSGERLSFNISEIKALRFDTDLLRDPDEARREFVFRLADDTRVTGRITACDGAKFTLENDYLGRFAVPMSAVTHITTDYFAQISGLRNDGPGCLFVLRDGSCARGQLLPPAPAKEGGRVTEFRYKDGDQIRVLPLAQVCGLVMPAAPAAPVAEGWYARVYLANFDLLVGTLELIDNTKIKIATPLMGEIEIDRRRIEELIFGPTPRATYDRILLCCAGSVVEYDELMRLTRTYATPQPIAATLLDNGNILVCDLRAKSVCEVDRRGQVVWKRDELLNVVAALRLPNGNTLVADYDLNAGRCLIVAPDGSELGRMFEIGREMQRASAADRAKVRVCDLSLLPNGNLLVSDMTEYYFSRIVETAADGTLVKVWGEGVARAAVARLIASGEVVVAAEHGNSIPPVTILALLDGQGSPPYLLEIEPTGVLQRLATTRADNIVLARREGGSLIFEEYEITRNEKKSVVFRLVSKRQLNANHSSGIINYELN